MSTRRASDAPPADADDLLPSLANLSMGPKKRLIIRLSVKCNSEYGVANITIDQKLVETSGTVPIVLVPGEVTIWMNHAFSDDDSLVHRLKFVRGSASQEENNYELRSFETGLYRDGGSTTHRLEYKHPTKEKWARVKLIEGGKSTLFELEYEY